MVHDGRIRHVAAVMSDMDFGMGNFLGDVTEKLYISQIERKPKDTPVNQPKVTGVSRR